MTSNSKIISTTGAALRAVRDAGSDRLRNRFWPERDGPETRRQLEESGALLPQDRDTIWDLFSDNDNPNVTVEVNRYLWQASLEILDFMPIEAADPFSGVISSATAHRPAATSPIARPSS
jgi:predicted deacylase